MDIVLLLIGVASLAAFGVVIWLLRTRSSENRPKWMKSEFGGLVVTLAVVLLLIGGIGFVVKGLGI